MAALTILTAIRTLAAAAVAAGVLVLAPSSATAVHRDPTPVRTDASGPIDAWIEGRMAARSVPGTAVAVVRGGRVVHLAGYGSADDTGRAVTADTPFILGSVSKPFTAAVVGQLVEEGRLAWDEPVWPHLSRVVDHAPEGFEEATVEQLLSHTGGLGMSVGTAGAVTIHDGPQALDRRVDELLSRPLASAPGEGFTYSNAGPVLLAAVVEQVTGRSFGEELQDRVFGPLGMSGSFATADDPRAADLATGHRQWFGRWRPAALPYDDAGVAMGYVVSTARDLAAFLQAHLDGHPAIPATAADIAADRVTPTGWTTTLDAGYGRGWFVDELAGTPVVSHPGSLGHFTAHVLLAPEADGLGVAVLSNASAFVAASHEAQYDLGLGLIHLLLGEEPQPADPSVLMVMVVPVVAWGVVALLVAAVVRSLVRWRAHGLPVATGRGTRRWAGALLPGAALAAVGVGLLAAPLSLARHFYPDAGWAVTVLAHLATGWGLSRLCIGLVALRRPRPAHRLPTQPASFSARSPEPTSASHRHPLPRPHWRGPWTDRPSGSTIGRTSAAPPPTAASAPGPRREDSTMCPSGGTADHRPRSSACSCTVELS